MAEAVQSLILTTLDSADVIENSADLQLDGKPVDQAVVIGVLKSLEVKEMVTFETITVEQWTLTAEGADLAANGSHEARVFEAVPPGPEGIPLTDLAKKAGESAKVGQGKAFKEKWLAKNGNNIIRVVESIVDVTKNDLVTIRDSSTHPNAATIADLKKRKLVDMSKKLSYKISKGKNFSTKVEKLATDLTLEMLVSGAWKAENFKKYNYDALGLPTSGGHLHPLLKVREEFRKIFLEMGFQEMPTNNYVESSFWNFDALFQPQQHPARDLHDTFFIKDPAITTKHPEEYLEKVKKVHSEGGFGSIGYRYDWKIEEAQKNLLRTHTTAVSARMLYKLAQQETFTPVKYFSIDRVYRNESLDATHLAEFHQIEGVIADRNLALGDLIGVLATFFEKLGIKKLRFKPAYNPYTEPSMEVFSYHEGLKRWVEVGNSGVFRPEMLEPMGLPSDVTVIAWGLSLERPTMIKYGISNIRDLVGHKVDLQMVQKNSICRLDK